MTSIKFFTRTTNKDSMSVIHVTISLGRGKQFYLNSGLKVFNDAWSTKLYVYAPDGHKICEAVSAEVLGFGEKCSQAALEKLMRDQKRQYRDSVEALEDFTTPYEERLEQGRPSDAVGKLDLMIGHAPRERVIALPQDTEFRAETADRRKKKRSSAGDEFLGAKADSALSRIRAVNE